VRLGDELPQRSEVLNCLKKTDLSKSVLLDFQDLATTRPSYFLPMFVSPTSVEIVEYQPNRVRLKVTADNTRLIVLTDVWYPGWSCTVDGHEEQVYRADFLFRAVRVPRGSHEVEFSFQPWSYRLGRLISLAFLGVVFAIGFLALSLRLIGR